jgi:hypothetical protein
MRYEEKIIEHEATRETPKFNEVIATIELSEGDMMELQKILRKSESTWGTQLIIDIENAFARRDYNMHNGSEKNVSTGGSNTLLPAVPIDNPKDAEGNTLHEGDRVVC